MAAYDVPERCGIRPVRVFRNLGGFADGPPLTEGQIKENQDNERNAQLQEEYNDLCQRLVNAIDDRIFLTHSLGFVASLVTGDALPIPCLSPNTQYEEASEDLSLPEKITIIKIRLADVRLTLADDIRTLSTLNKVLVGRGSEHSVTPESSTPGILYRAFRSSSYSRYDKGLGFRSSRQPFTLPSNHYGPLHESSLVDQDVLKNHCEGRDPSDLIAMCDSPVRVLRFIQNWKFKDRDGEMIAVIDVSKLLVMGVLFSRTTTLCTKLGIDTWNPSRGEGLSWVNPNYWVAYRWIPAECIEFCVSEQFLRSACKEHSIGDRNPDQQLSLDDLLGQRMKSLSI